MIRITNNSSYFQAALSASLIFHLVMFGVAAAMQSKVQRSAIKEYLPVELVQMPSPPQGVVRAPVAAAPRPVKVSAPVMEKERSVTAPPQVTQKVAELSQTPNDAPMAGLSLPSRAFAVPGSGSVGKEQPGTSGIGAPQPQGRDKGSYQAFHRLTRLPSFKSRAEPVYPNTERMTGNEARVLAEIYLDEHGKVDDVTIKKSGGRLFDKAVIDAARQSSFHPGYIGEKAVPSVIQIPYTFKLK